jgi:hypothetical protein
MESIAYKIDSPEKFSVKEKKIICEMLIKQGKVAYPSIWKINNFKMLCVCLVNDKIVSVGSIKPKTEDDFEKNQANLPDLSKDFTWELGSCYTEPGYTGKGYSSAIVKILIENSGNENLTAVTDIKAYNPMVRILDHAGFKQYGNAWKSSYGEEIFRLFLRYASL